MASFHGSMRVERGELRAEDAALNLVTAAIILFSCRYLDRAVSSLKISAGIGNEEALRQLSPVGRDHINLTGDYVWSDPAAFDADGFLPLKISER